VEFKWKPVDLRGDDFTGISDLRENFENKGAKTNRRSYGPDYYFWKLRKNPVTNGSCTIADVEGNPVGFATVTPKRIKIKNEVIIGSEIGDTFTHPDFQRQGIFTEMVKGARESSISNGLHLIYGTPNNLSLPGYQKKCNFDVVPAAKVSNLVMPLNFFRVFHTRFNSKSIAFGLSLAVAPWIKALRFLLTPRTRADGISIQNSNTFPDTVDELWTRASKNYDVILERSKDYLNWRFVNNPDDYQIFLIHEHERLVGYFVLKIGFWSDLKVGYIADIFADENDSRVLSIAARFIVNFYKEQRVDLISTWLVDCPKMNIFKRSGFFKFKQVPIICYKNNLGLEVIKSDLKWYFTLSDSDNI